jgi:hypothetical protein
MGCVAMAGAGAIYSRILGRAANSSAGGWLFGLAFGFVMWAVGAVMILPVVSRGLTPTGVPALGFFLSLLIWGLALGVLLPFIHRPLQKRITRIEAGELGPNAAIGRTRAGPQTNSR